MGTRKKNWMAKRERKANIKHLYIYVSVLLRVVRTVIRLNTVRIVSTLLISYELSKSR